MKRWAVPGSADDTYAQHPWRAPGSAPVADPCGMAGGMPVAGGGASVFAKTVVAQGWGQPTTLAQGMLGTQVLKKGPAAANWTAGETVEVSWGIRANHGGGYQYRLCPVKDHAPITEACFQDTPSHLGGQYITNSNVAPLFFQVREWCHQSRI